MLDKLVRAYERAEDIDTAENAITLICQHTTVDPETVAYLLDGDLSTSEKIRLLENPDEVWSSRDAVLSRSSYVDYSYDKWIEVPQVWRDLML